MPSRLRNCAGWHFWAYALVLAVLRGNGLRCVSQTRRGNAFFGTRGTVVPLLRGAASANWPPSHAGAERPGHSGIPMTVGSGGCPTNGVGGAAQGPGSPFGISHIKAQACPSGGAIMKKKKTRSVQYALRWRLVGNRWRLVGNRWRLVGNRWRLVGTHQTSESGCHSKKKKG